MIIRSISLKQSAAAKSQFPGDNLPQVVVSGRSNVGKSSFINAMLNNNRVARVSQTPGKTRLINFFLINESFYFVDIPGYGYARVNQDMLTRFHQLIESYLESATTLCLAILLLDIRHNPTKDDLLMKAYFESRGYKIVFVLTKADKLSGNQRAKQRALIQNTLALEKTDRMVMFSSHTKENRDLLWELIEKALVKEAGPDAGKIV